MGDGFPQVGLGLRHAAETSWVGKWGAPHSLVVGAGSPSNTMSPGPRPIHVPSGILIYLTVLPRYTNVTCGQDTLTTVPYSIGRTVKCNGRLKLQTLRVATDTERQKQKLTNLLSFFFPRLISAVVDWMSTIFTHMVWS